MLSKTNAGTKGGDHFFYATIAFFHMFVVEHTLGHEIKIACFLYNMTKIRISRIKSISPKSVREKNSFGKEISHRKS
jgi:hypothetical protein